jgi:hypothetical protein
MKPIALIFPIGGGGHWLNSTIRGLETGNKILPNSNNTVWFDHSLQSTNIHAGSHGASWATGIFIKDDLSTYKHTILFSTEYLFNLYLLNASKALLNKNRSGNILHLTMIEQFFALSNHARFMIANQDYSNFYCKNITLNTRLIFQEPLQFITNLFDVLDNCQIAFDRDYDFCLQSIELFLKTCERPTDHLGNFESQSWVSWCHALSLIYNLPLDGILANAESINDIASILYPHKDQFIKLTDPMMFYWN